MYICVNLHVTCCSIRLLHIRGVLMASTIWPLAQGATDSKEVWKRARGTCHTCGLWFLGIFKQTINSYWVLLVNNNIDFEDKVNQVREVSCQCGGSVWFPHW